MLRNLEMQLRGGSCGGVIASWRESFGWAGYGVSSWAFSTTRSFLAASQSGERASVSFRKGKRQSYFDVQILYTKILNHTPI